MKYFKLTFILLSFCAILAACNEGTSQSEGVKDKNKKGDEQTERANLEVPKRYTYKGKAIDIQGHRGARGYFPENTVEGFFLALSQGATTVEMDVVVDKNNILVVSHEPYMNSKICLDAKGQKIAKANEMEHNIYQMDQGTIKSYDCGSIGHEDFPEQKKIKKYKPTLIEVLKKCEAYAEMMGLPEPRYNIEIKSDPRGDDTFHPGPEQFSELVVEAIGKARTKARTTIQSFDIRNLQYLHEKHPDFYLSYLVSNRLTFQSNIQTLGFEPDVYSPNYKSLTGNTIRQCTERGIKLIPWTVNELSEIQINLEKGVDGIISDYPDRVVELMD